MKKILSLVVVLTLCFAVGNAQSVKKVQPTKGEPVKTEIKDKPLKSKCDLKAGCKCTDCKCNPCQCAKEKKCADCKENKGCGDCKKACDKGQKACEKVCDKDVKKPCSGEQKKCPNDKKVNPGIKKPVKK